jgi:hypothetical protein
MAQIAITIPDNKMQAVLDAFAVRFGYEAQIFNPAFDQDLPEDPQTNPLTIPNPENKAQFAKRMLITQIRKIYNQGKMREFDLQIKDDLNDLT